jgi:hypothetical protein
MGISNRQRSSVQVIEGEARENAIRALVWLAEYPDECQWATETLQWLGASDQEITAERLHLVGVPDLAADG